MNHNTAESPCDGLEKHKKESIVPPDQKEWHIAALQLAAWSQWWSQWNSNLVEAIVPTLKKLDQDKYKDVLDQLAQWGDEMRHEGCKNAQELRRIIQRAQSREADTAGVIIVDSTQPPPPPFRRATR